MFLAACDSVEERAEEHFQSGLALLEDGDIDRALLEFRNAYRLDPAHIESRRVLARVMLDDLGDPRRAYRQFLRVAEQDPDDLEARIELSEIAFSLSNWDEVTRHGERALSLAPENPRVQAISLILQYRTAVEAEDQSLMRDLVRTAEEMLETQPDNLVLRSMRSDGALRDGELETALEDIDWLLERDPENVRLMQQRLAVLGQLGDNDAVEAQLLTMIEQSPSNSSYEAALLQFYLNNDMTDKATDYMRTRAAESDEVERKMDLVNFLRQVDGPDAAEAELDRLIAETDSPIVFQVVKAALAFDRGEQDEAIALLETTLRDTPEEGDLQASVLDAKVTLARMQLATGNEVGARARVAEVLARNPDHPAALSIQSAWQIEGDEVETAIANLRSVLDSEPENAQAMTLMAQAYQRAGQNALAQDFLALAVEASGYAPAETIRYARLLADQENFLSAEDQLLTALRNTPRNVDLLTALGEVYVATEDFGRLEQVIQALRGFETPETARAADQFEATRINLQNGTEEALQFLEGMVANADASLGARLTLVQARLSTGDFDSALEELGALADENPGNVTIILLQAATEAAAGNFEASESLYRGILTENPTIGSAPWLQLSQVKVRQGDRPAARAMIDEALTHLPDSGNLLWAKASYLEQEGDIDGAIGIYEDLYARNSSSVIVANNLASMLSTYRMDDESLERAWIVARRFRETEIPQMQDTYGWILHRRGETADALPYLERAAAGLPGDPVVQYHLGQSYLANDRTADAIAQFEKVVEIANPADQRPQIADARVQLETLSAPAAIVE